ncbi:TRAP transporter small permease subunit [Phreatobacter sp.]|uniref:TRAP transporter small permease subunit n=1 Tax=Phreatobacter sp. TaxID=1966341 RepID=UPI003F700366
MIDEPAREGEAGAPASSRWLRPFLAADRILGRLTQGSSAIGTAWIVALMVLINADVIGRGLFNHPIAGTPELVTLSIIAIVFLQLPDAARRQSLTRSESLIEFVRLRRPRVADALASIYEFIGAGLFSIIAWATFPQALKAWSRGEFIGNPGLLTVAKWPLLGLTVLGSVLLAAQFLANGIRALQRVLRAGDDSHVR